MSPLRAAVIGAGPAGSTAARLLAEGGADVTLFEARRLPRPKLCGGGLTPKAQRLVPADVLGTVERLVERVELRAPHLAPIRLADPTAVIAMVERDRFDLALVEAAARAGVSVRDVEPVRELVEEAGGVTVRTDRGVTGVDLAIVADGQPSATARTVGLDSPAHRLALALEVDVPFSADIGQETAMIAYGLPGGYGWYFPKGDHANIGVGSYRSARLLDLRVELARLARSVGLDVSGARIAGHWIPQGLRTGPLATRRVMLAGDAAATADPFFGEGISYAILSGVVAAQTVGAWSDGEFDDLRPYDARLRGMLGPALGRLGTIARLAEVSTTAAVLVARLSATVRERAADAIVGRGWFAIDRHCELACLCSRCSRHGSKDSVCGLMESARHGHDSAIACQAACAA